jgi:hypothetical protein
MTIKSIAERWAERHSTEAACLCIVSLDRSGIGKWSGTNKYIAEQGLVREIRVGVERRPSYPIVVIDPEGQYYRGIEGCFTLGQEGKPVVGNIPAQAAGKI